MATQLLPSKRTQGDGMEKVENEILREETVILRPQNLKEKAIVVDESEKISPQTVVKSLGAVVKLTPSTVDKKKKDILSNLKNKEPKFVPYEPYKAAVRPIVPPSKNPEYTKSEKKRSKAFLATLNNQKKIEVIEKVEVKNKEIKEPFELDWESKLKAMQLEVQNLKEENEQLENQLKFQVQVNGELKNLLVAAVGEDMETKVHVLTEDKLHLAQALLKSAESLSTHQEQTEWLAGQCEVWRSKFLASSVMVEELARWKASLSQKVNETHDVLKKILDERKQIKEFVIETHKNLCKLRDNFDLHSKKTNANSFNVIEVAHENLKLSETLLLELLGFEKKPSAFQKSSLDYTKKSVAEISAENVLANPSMLQLISEPDAACNAVVGAAVNLSGQLYLQNHPPKIECCPQCVGEIKLV